MKQIFTNLNTISGHPNLASNSAANIMLHHALPMTPYVLCPTLPDTYQTQKHLHTLNCCTPQFNLTQDTADHIEHNSTAMTAYVTYL